MNARIVQLFGLVVVMLGLIVGFTSYWAVFAADDLRDHPENRRELLAQQQLERGTIRTADGVMIARSTPRGEGSGRVYTRTYPEGSLYGHPIGYSYVDRGSSQFEERHDDVLAGETTELGSIIEELRGGRQEGDHIVTSLQDSLQGVATDALAGQAGSVVAIEPATGKVRAMAAVPGYDPNRIPDELGALNRDAESPLLDRSVQSGYPPGSTMKALTAAAAIDSGELEPETAVDGSSPMEVQGRPLANFGGATYGEIPLTEALASSVNTAFARVSEQLGTSTLFEYMDRFGFNSVPEVDLPDDEMFTSGVYAGGERIGPGDPVDVGRLGIGQERLLVTPLQMAQIAAGIANRGELMQPRIWERVVDPDGRTVREMSPSPQSRAISEESAAELTSMMQTVVDEGTGTSAAIEGIDVAGKTGTAEVPGRAGCEGLPNQAWFIGFAPADDPEIAVAATVECTSGQGGTVAAPIARTVIEAALESGG